MSQVPDCLTCGACCMCVDPDADTHVNLLPADKVRLGPDPNIDGNFLRTKKDPYLGTACVYLVGVKGKQVACEIHDKRPLACRLFEAGSRDCLRVRRQHGLEP